MNINKVIQRLLDRWKAEGVTETWGGMSHGQPVSIDGGGYGDPHEQPARPDWIEKDNTGWESLVQFKRSSDD